MVGRLCGAVARAGGAPVRAGRREVLRLAPLHALPLLLGVELPVLADVVPQVSVQVVRVVLHEGDLLQVARDILPVLFANAI